MRPQVKCSIQDAEGDGLVAARKFMRDWLADCGLPYNEQDGFWGVGDALTQYESSIRADYEELVKAARAARSALMLLTSELSGQIGYINGLQQRPHGQPQRAIEHAHVVGARVSAALTSIEESPGRRKDG